MKPVTVRLTEDMSDLLALMARVNNLSREKLIVDVLGTYLMENGEDAVAQLSAKASKLMKGLGPKQE